MQSTSIALRHICPHYPIHLNPSLNSQSLSLHFSKKKTTHKTYLQQQPPHLPTTNSIYYSLSSCSKEQEHKNHNNSNPSSTNHQTQPFLEQFYSSVETKRTQLPQTEDQEAEKEIESEGISTNMWWAEMKAAIGQRINVDGLVCALAVVTRDRQLVIPHVSVKDVRHIDWAELKKNGFQGVVFDKDNTITAPYSLALWAPLGSSMEWCKSVFGDNIAVFSNSSGLQEYDPDGRKARTLESAIGIRVVRHRVKKPAGTAEEIEGHFGCESSKLIMVGDRPFTDIVYGNRNGFLTILTEPLSLAEEPFIVKQVRKLEVALVNRWYRKGCRPNSHRLLPDVQQCVKDLPTLTLLFDFLHAKRFLLFDFLCAKHFVDSDLDGTFQKARPLIVEQASNQENLIGTSDLDQALVFEECLLRCPSRDVSFREAFSSISLSLTIRIGLKNSPATVLSCRLLLLLLWAVLNFAIKVQNCRLHCRIVSLGLILKASTLTASFTVSYGEGAYPLYVGYAIQMFDKRRNLILGALFGITLCISVGWAVVGSLCFSSQSSESLQILHPEMESQRSKNASSSLLLWALVAALLSQDLVSTVASSFVDQKNYYFPPTDPHSGTPPPVLFPPSGTPPSGHHTPSHGTPPSHTPSYGTPPSHSGGGYTPPSHGSHGGTPPANCGTPPSPHYDPSPSPPTGGGGYHYSPPTVTPTPSTPTITPITPTPPTSFSPPTTPIDPGTPSVPGSKVKTNVRTQGGSYWRTHPGLIWGVFGFWGTTITSAFGVTSLPGIGGHMSLPQALSNTRTDGIGALYREGTAALLNSMVHTRFPFTTDQVRDSFISALGSNKAAATQARVFKLANEGRLKPRT
ncbi:hypothetical protein LguiA_022203 [Lonicera macranthoides]